MWTEKLQQMTRDHFENIMKGAFMKKFGDNKYGLCVFIEEKYTITDRESDEVWEYDTMEEMLTDGWALD